MFRRGHSSPTSPPEDPSVAPDAGPRASGTAAGPAPRATEPSLDALPVIGISRRRLAFIVGLALTAWVVVVFARQVGDASAAQARADQIRAQNAVLADQVASLQREEALIQQQSYVNLMARSFGMGTSKERPFSLAPGAPTLPADAPGSAAVRIGAQSSEVTPLDSWLSLLFGPAR